MGKQFLITLISTIGGFVFGSDVGIISKIQTYDSFQDLFRLNNTKLGLMVAMLLLGAMVGSLSSSYIAELYGRKKSIIIGSLIFIVGVITQVSASGQYIILLLGRLFTGLAIGELSTIVPMYLSEVCDPQLRGMLVSCQQLAITVGILVAFLAAKFTEDVFIIGLEDWQLALLLQLIPTLFMFFGMLTLPASPRWLLTKRRHEDAKIALANLRGKAFKDVETEYYDLKLLSESEPEELSWSDAWQKYRSRILIGVFIQMFQQISGINALMYYSTKMYSTLLPQHMDTLAACQNVLNVVGTIPALFLVDRLGRKSLLLAGSAGCTIGMFITAISMLLPTPFPIVAVIGIFIFIINFAYAIGPLPWVICAEIFPSCIRSKAVAASIASNWIFNLIVSFSAPILLDGIGPYTFFLFGSAMAIFYIWISKKLPETKGLTLEEVDKLLNKGNR
eukprot:NODE_149_length_17312_cov_0.399349.p3 type:complete len:448 gc:universal NODE_149_length_17312_cov_0.399349:6242-7585(+)